jgi:hypothetical protein
MAEPVDREAFDTLAGELLQLIHAHYLRRPRGRAAVFEVLKALASVSAYVMAGCVPEVHRIRMFFNQAMTQEFADLMPGGPPPGQRH